MTSEHIKPRVDGIGRENMAENGMDKYSDGLTPLINGKDAGRSRFSFRYSVFLCSGKSQSKTKSFFKVSELCGNFDLAQEKKFFSSE